MKNEPDLYNPRLLSGAEIAYIFRLALSGESIIKAFTPRPFVEPQLPPESDSRSEHDVLTHPEPQEPEAADFEIISGTEINTKKNAVKHIFFKLLVSGEIRSIPPERLTNHMAEQVMLRFPRFSKITSSDVNYALKDLDVYKPYHRQKSKSVKAFSASGEKTKHMLEGSQSVDEDSQEAVDARIDKAELESLIRSQRECGKHGN